MVKRQKEKQYESAREHRSNSLLRSNRSATSKIARLPFDCCALTLTPFTNPVCTSQGVIFENSAIVPYLLRHKKDPVTGLAMSSKDLITLTMDKDDDEESDGGERGGGSSMTTKWCCPVLRKRFTNFSKIVAVRDGNAANVYSYEAVEELNLKAKNYEDLISGKKFRKKEDVILLQDPKNEEHGKLRDINNFVHTKKMRAEGASSSGKERGDVTHSVTAQRIMDKLADKNRKKEEERKRKRDDPNSKSEENAKNKVFSEDVHGVSMTSGKCSGSLTSSVMSISNSNDAREATNEEVLQAQFIAMKKMKKKGYACLRTNLGDLDLELHCDIAPRTTTNFLTLAKRGKYDESVFHRSIKHFMIQGGKPKGDQEEESIWGGPFVDEFDERLKHTEKGILSMANAGPGTNKAQFFITYKSCPHLDRKHSIFGRVINGFDILAAMESTSTDKKDRPKEQMIIHGIDVISNPAEEAEESERSRIQGRQRMMLKEKESRRAYALGKTNRAAVLSSVSDTANNPSDQEIAGISRIGKYLPKNALKNLNDHANSAIPIASRLPSAPKKSNFGDFSGW